APDAERRRAAACGARAGARAGGAPAPARRADDVARRRPAAAGARARGTAPGRRADGRVGDARADARDAVRRPAASARRRPLRRGRHPGRGDPREAALMPLSFLVGGARSGKSRLALSLAAKSGAPVVFVATGEARDEEMAVRIERHRAERPRAWTTVEEPLRLREAIEAAPPEACVVVDCLTLWVANLLERGEEPGDDVAAVAAARGGRTIAVSNE